jgi:hypothetical protein
MEDLVYEAESDDAKSDVDLDCGCESGRMGRDGSGGIFGFRFVLVFELDVANVLKFRSWVWDENDALAGNGGGGFGGKEGCTDAEASVVPLLEG